MARKKAKPVSASPSGVSRAAKRVRDLLADYTAQRSMKEGAVGLLLFGYLVAKLGPARVRREFDVDTISATGKRGRPEQVDFVIGRKRQSDSKFHADTVVELAVRREGHAAGADASVNLSEISKLVRADAKHRVLLLIDITANDRGAAILGKYLTRGYGRGRPRGISTDRIAVVYVGENGTTKIRLKRQTLKPKLHKASS